MRDPTHARRREIRFDTSQALVVERQNRLNEWPRPVDAHLGELFTSPMPFDYLFSHSLLTDV
jgi:hypothetical protein